MAVSTRLIAGAVVGLLLTGCGAAPETSGQLLDRLNSAEGISTPSARDTALAGIARDAARSRQAGLCLRSVDGIVAVGLHDQTAQACARTADDLGDRPTAELLVGRISSVAVRDRLRIDFANRPAPARSTEYY